MVILIGQMILSEQYKKTNKKRKNNIMEALMWLALAGVTIVVGKWIGKKIWPEDWEEFDNRHK